MLRKVTFCTIAFLLPLASFAQEEKGEDERRSIEQLIAAVNSAEFPHEVGDAYRDLFAGVGKDGLAALQRDSDTSISVQAAWAKVEGTLTDEERNEGLRPHDKQALSRFVGFVEGRTRMPIPQWWADFVVKGPVEARQTWYHNAGLGLVFAPNDTQVTVNGGKYTLRIADESVELPDSILTKSDQGNLWCRFSGLFTEKHCFIAVHNDVGYSHKVACIDRTTGNLDWASDACGCWFGGASGIHESWVTVAVQQEQVVIFGASWTGFYMHAFDVVTGKSRWRFSTAFGTSY